MALAKVIEEYGGAGSLIHFPNMIRKELVSKNITDMSKAMPNKLKEAKGAVRDKFLATLMLNGANAATCNELKRSMAENYVTERASTLRARSLYCASSAHTSCRPGGTSTNASKKQGLEQTKELLCLVNWR